MSAGRVLLAAVVLWAVLGGVVGFTSEPGPNAGTVLLQRYGWALLAGGLVAAVAGVSAVLWPAQAAGVALCAVVAAAGAWSWAGVSPVELARRTVLRSRWVSVARSCGLGVTRDRRSAEWPGGAVLEGAVAPAVEYLPTLSRGRSVPGGVVYRLTPARGSTVDAVADQAEALAAGLRVALVEVVRVRPDRGRLAVYWNRREA